MKLTTERKIVDGMFGLACVLFGLVYLLEALRPATSGPVALFVAPRDGGEPGPSREPAPTTAADVH